MFLEILDYDMHAVPNGKEILTRHVTSLTLTNLESISNSYCSVQLKDRVGIS